MSTDPPKATPRPWQLHLHNGSPKEERDFSDSAGRIIGHCHPYGRRGQPSMIEARANAALIVKAVNERDDLVAALRRITERYVGLAGSGDCGWWNPEEEDEVIAARAALAKAEAP